MDPQIIASYCHFMGLTVKADTTAAAKIFSTLGDLNNALLAAASYVTPNLITAKVNSLLSLLNVAP